MLKGICAYSPVAFLPLTNVTPQAVEIDKPRAVGNAV